MQIQALVAAGHTTVAIAEALDVDISIVRAVAGTATEGDAADMKAVLKSIALDRAAKPADRIKAAIYINEEAHGRNDKRASSLLAVTPVIEMATRLAEARTRALPAKSRTIDVDAIVNGQLQPAMAHG